MVNPLHFLDGYELTNITLLAGLLASTGVQRASGVSPGGVVAAAFLVLAAVDSIWWALLMPIMAIVIAKIYKRFFSHIYRGREPIFIMAALSITGMTAIGLVMGHYHLVSADQFTFPLGIITPAILAASLHKQGIAQTFGYTLLATAITLEVVACIYLIGLWLGHDFHAIDQLIGSRSVLMLNGGTILSLVSVIIGFCIFRWKGVKSAGYIMLPFLATLLMVSPLNFLLIVGLSVIAYAVTAAMRRYSLIIGIGRYTFVAILSITLAWTAEYLLLRTTSSFSPFMGTSIFAALAITVLVNEHTIYGIRRAGPLFALGLLLMVGFEFGSAFGYQKLSHQPLSAQPYSITGARQ